MESDHSNVGFVTLLSPPRQTVKGMSGKIVAPIYKFKKKKNFLSYILNYFKNSTFKTVAQEHILEKILNE